MTQMTCCRRDGLRYPDGAYRCGRCAHAGDRAIVARLDERARSLRFSASWPNGPAWDLVERERFLDWIKQHRLRPMSVRCDNLHWLRHPRSMCTRKDCPNLKPTYRWADHVTKWKNRHGGAVLVAHPYGLFGNDRAQLAELDADPALWVEIHDPDAGWYGGGAQRVEIWRASAAS